MTGAIQTPRDASYETTLQRTANASLGAGGLDRVGRGALGLLAQPFAKMRGLERKSDALVFILAQPFARMRGLERSQGELAFLGIENDGVDRITQRGRDLSTQLARVNTRAPGLRWTSGPPWMNASPRHASRVAGCTRPAMH